MVIIACAVASSPLRTTIRSFRLTTWYHRCSRPEADNEITSAFFPNTATRSGGGIASFSTEHAEKLFSRAGSSKKAMSTFVSGTHVIGSFRAMGLGVNGNSFLPVRWLSPENHRQTGHRGYESSNESFHTRRFHSAYSRRWRSEEAYFWLGQVRQKRAGREGDHWIWRRSANPRPKS